MNGKEEKLTITITWDTQALYGKVVAKRTVTVVAE